MWCRVKSIFWVFWVQYVGFRFGYPVNQRFYKSYYDPIRGREVLHKQTGAFTNTLRTIGLGKLAGDSENGFLLNHIMPQSHDAVSLINHFFHEADNVKPTFEAFNGNPKTKTLIVGLKKYPVKIFSKNGETQYSISIPVNLHSNDTRDLRIFAKNDTEFLNKVKWLQTYPVARAKLDYKISKLNPLEKGYVFFNENKIVGTVNKIQEFETIHTTQQAELYDSPLGGSDAKQINQYSPSIHNFGVYSYKNKKALDITDKLYFRILARTRMLVDANRLDEVLGTIYNMYQGGKPDTKEMKAHTIRALREDFLYNLYGNPHQVLRQIDHFPDSYRTTSLMSSPFGHIQLFANPLRGRQFWKQIPCDVKQAICSLYYTQGNCEIGFKYDVNPQKFLADMRKKFLIEPADRQYMARYSRKVLGIYTVLDFLREELQKVSLDKNRNTKEKQQKFSDLNILYDDLFETLGDMRDIFRSEFSGFTQFKQALFDNKELAPLNSKIIKQLHVKQSENTTANQTNHATANQANPEKKSKNIKKASNRFFDALCDTTENYIYVNTLLHNELRPTLGNHLYKHLKNECFDKKTSDIVSAAGTIMTMEGIEKISNHLHNVVGGMAGNANLRGSVGFLFHNASKGDIKALEECKKLLECQFSHIAQQDLLKAGVKYRDIVSEALFLIRHKVPNKLDPYPTQDREHDIHNLNPVTSRLTEMNARAMSRHLVLTIGIFSEYIDKIKVKMARKQEPNPYMTQTIMEMTDAMRIASQKASKAFVCKHQYIWGDLSDDEIKLLYKHVAKQYFGFMQLLANVAVMIRDNPEAIKQPAK